MTPPPPTGPGPAETEAHARELTDALIRLSKEILIQSTNPQLPELGQLIMRRGLLLEEFNRLSLDGLPETTRQALQESLAHCRKMDQSIETNLGNLRTDLGEQLKHLKEGRSLLNKYRAGQSTPPGSLTEDA